MGKNESVLPNTLRQFSERTRFDPLADDERHHRPEFNELQVGACGRFQCRQTLIKRIMKHAKPPTSADCVSPIRSLRAIIITADPRSAAVAYTSARRTFEICARNPPRIVPPPTAVIVPSNAAM